MVGRYVLFFILICEEIIQNVILNVRNLSIKWLPITDFLAYYQQIVDDNIKGTLMQIWKSTYMLVFI